MNPPPPPPHGEPPKSSGLPPGKYDIFIIPEHSSGSGFLYLPSLRPNVNSFAAGFATALIIVVIGSALAPILQAWWNGVKGSGGMGMILLIFAIAVGAWALGRAQIDQGPGPGGGPPPSANGHAGTHTGAHPNSNGYANGHAGGPPPQSSGPPPGAGAGTGPKPTWQRSTPAPGATGAAPKPSTPGSASNGAWEKAREETRKREEERKAKEAEKKRREELEKRLKELREKEAREREAREKKLREEDGKEKEKETERQKERQKDLERARERLKELAKESAKPPPSTYAFSSTGEKTNPWPQGRPASPSSAPKPRPSPSSPTKKPPPPPTAKTYLGTEDDAYSYRPYDKPTRPLHKKTPSSIYSESSYAASHSTSHTTPPPSNRGPYRTKDPDKIVIKAVYSFNNAFLKTPTSQLVSGVGSVTDGLILRITTEGLFIDDDVRGVPQREWDVKAWTMKLVETGELKSARLHVLRASIRDQEGKKYVFVITEEESWKVAVGLQKLRKGAQVRALGVSGMSTNDARGTLENLGWV